jgi:hypothetical protein
MKNLLYLFLAVTMFACSSGGDGSDNSLDFDCADFDGSTSQSDARNIAINYDSEDYYSLVSEYGEPISEGYFVSDSEYYLYSFMFEDNQSEADGNKICYTVDDQCVTYTYSAGCSDIEIIDDCEECVFYYYTRVN